MGSSQNFFRVRMYDQNSDKNSISFLFATKSNRPPKSLSYTVAKQGINKAGSDALGPQRERRN